MAKKNLHEGHRERLRDKFRKHGLDAFSEHEILELLLCYSVPRKDTNELAHKIIDEYKTLINVFDAPMEELENEMKLSEVGATLIAMVPQLAKVYETLKWKRKAHLPDTEAIGQYTVSLFKEKLNEEFGIICLDGNRNVKWGGTILKGTINETVAYPRIVVKEVLRHNASQVVFIHNHPSGTLAPSVADKQATEKLVNILRSIDVNVLDHIIVSKDSYFSMAEMGFFG